jgi:hypothetical protein
MGMILMHSHFLLIGNYDTLLATKRYFEDKNILDLSSNNGSLLSPNSGGSFLSPNSRGSFLISTVENSKDSVNPTIETSTNSTSDERDIVYMDKGTISTSETENTDNENTENKKTEIENTENEKTEIENTRNYMRDVFNDNNQYENSQKLINNISHIFIDYISTRSDQVFGDVFMKEILIVWINHDNDKKNIRRIVDKVYI